VFVYFIGIGRKHEKEINNELKYGIGEEARQEPHEPNLSGPVRALPLLSLSLLRTTNARPSSRLAQSSLQVHSSSLEANVAST